VILRGNGGKSERQVASDYHRLSEPPSPRTREPPNPRAPESVSKSYYAAAREWLTAESAVIGTEP